MDDLTLLSQSQTQIIQDLSLDSTSDGTSWRELEEWLSDQIAYMIDHQFEKLLQSLYRIDVSETTVSRILSDRSSDIPRCLAQAIIQREKQKVVTREQYRSDTH